MQPRKDTTIKSAALCRRRAQGSLAAARESPFDVPHDLPPGFRSRDLDQPCFPLLCEGYRVLQAQPGSYWRLGMLLALKTVRIRITPLMLDPVRGIANPRGRTIPLLSNTIDLREDIAAKVDCESLQVLLHELAHRCGAVLPEWKLWFGNRYPPHEIYGRHINSADAISMGMLERACPGCRWPD
jgi:hypothetical protein